jgi:hypothetical protein
MSKLGRVSTVLGAVVLAGGLSAIAPVPASAHTSTFHLTNNRGYGRVYNPHYAAEVCDERADNWGVRIYLRNAAGGTGFAGDGNGSAAGCGSAHAGAAKWTSYRVCAGESGLNTICSPWITP